MILDQQLLASDGQAVTATALSANVIDLGAARDLGRGQPLRAVAVVTAAFAGGTSIRADLVESDEPDLSPATVLAAGPVVATADAGAGCKLADLVAPSTSRRYLGFSYTVVGAMTAGEVTAGLVSDTDSGRSYPAATGL
jgi:hypothetical protein